MIGAITKSSSGTSTVFMCSLCGQNRTIEVPGTLWTEQILESLGRLHHTCKPNSGVKYVRELYALGFSVEDILALVQYSQWLHKFFAGIHSGKVVWCETSERYYSKVETENAYYCENIEKKKYDAIAKVLGKIPGVQWYINRCPFGPVLYVIGPGELPMGEDVDSYSGGIAVY